MNKPKPIRIKPILRKRRMKRPANVMVLGGSEPSGAMQKKDLKFAGPIKVIVVEPKSEYCKAVWCAICVGLTYVAIGAVNMSVFHYSLITGDSHATVCCIAYHFFSAEAITALHYANGWSAPMRLRHRKFAHVFLHLCGIACALVGTILVVVSTDISTLPHGLTGIITGILVILTALIGPCALFKKHKKPWLVTLHMSIGIPAFIMSSICICLGIILKPFRDWADEKKPEFVSTVPGRRATNKATAAAAACGSDAAT